MQIKKIFIPILILSLIIGSILCGENIYIKTSLAASKPTISSKITIYKGKSKTLSINPNGFTITRIIPKSADKSIATAKNKNSYVVITGKKKGSTTVTTSVKARKGKNIKTYKLKTKVTVKVESITSVNIKKFSELKNALSSMEKVSGTVNLTSDEVGEFEISSGNYKKVKLYINAPNASIINKATLKSITINNLLNKNSYTEEGNGNSIVLSSNNPINIIIPAGKTLNSLTCNGSVSSAEQNIDVYGVLTNIYIKGIAPAYINALATSTKINLVEVSTIGARTTISAGIGSTLNKIRLLKPSTTELTGASTSAILVERVSTASVMVDPSLTGVIIKEIAG